jgi:RND superfamily putative drug exporter
LHVRSIGDLRRPVRWAVIAAWIVAAVAIVMTAPALESTQDQSEFLPSHYESVKALAVQQEAFPQRGEIGGIVVFDRLDGGKPTTADQAKIGTIAEALNKEEFSNLGRAAVTPASKDGLVQAIFIQVQKGKNAFDPKAIDDAKAVRASLEKLIAGTDLHSGLTGAAAQSLDSEESAGPTVVAAGLILAGTFASLMLAEGSFFKSMGFSFSSGIAMAAFVMALFLTPALTALIGHAAWWPGHGDATREKKSWSLAATGCDQAL